MSNTVKRVEEGRKRRIQELKDCGQSIIDNAERIIGDFKYPISVKVEIVMEANAVTTIQCMRSFAPEHFVERLAIE